MFRKHLEELEKRHQEAESRRNLRENELKDSIVQKVSLIETQEIKVKELHVKCDRVITENNDIISGEVELFCVNRSNETRILKHDIRQIVDQKRNRNDSKDEINLEELHIKWLNESNKIQNQEKLCTSLSNELQSFLKDYDSNNDKNTSDEEKLQLEQNKEELLQAVNNANTGLEELCHEKAKTLRKFQQVVYVSYLCYSIKNSVSVKNLAPSH